ncbi:MAG TPA: Mrp/NBP35 family ATP-binding protein [Gemmatimonadaceae bacterium]|nr:Mrp/NBP35 family ATP-binding protein [Gemmatimonadaceae bacterium]
MAEPLQARIAAALRSVINPRTGQDVITSEMIRDVGVSVEGRVRFSILLAAQDPASLVREVRLAVEKVEGVSDVRVDVKDPSQSAAPAASSQGAASPAQSAAHAAPHAAPHGPTPGGQSAPPGRSRSLPVMGQEPQSRRAAVPAPTPVAYPNLGRIVAVSSGKGGVGKSTVAVNLAIALAQSGARVGLMDADIYGPNIPRMMGVDEPPRVVNDRILPLEAHGVKVMSLGFLIERDQPAIWRGPIVMKIITQFLRDVEWGELDYFLVDMPPGTGDAQLSLVQATNVHGAVIVTTPQPVATGDALRGARMFQRVGVPVLGIVENMSYFVCDCCGTRTALFGEGGGRKLADELGLPLLGEIPLQPEVRTSGDEGKPIVVADRESPVSRAISDTARQITATAESAIPA